MKTIAFYTFKIVASALFLSMNMHGQKPFVKFDDNKYVARYEVTNQEYNEFLSAMQNQLENKDFATLLPDSGLWIDRFPAAMNQPMANYYHSHPAYYNYPVVNISKEAMEQFCDWKTKQYNQIPKRQFTKVLFRLPTEKEWMLFAGALPGQKLPWHGAYPYKINKKGEPEYLANIKIMDYGKGEFDYGTDGALYTATVGNYPPNQIGIYEIVGNVAEQTSDSKAKGGSWYNTLEECLIDQSQDYPAPDPRVGFRLVFEVLKK